VEWILESLKKIIKKATLIMINIIFLIIRLHTKGFERIVGDINTKKGQYLTF
jgi:hypothetical protein